MTKSQTIQVRVRPEAKSDAESVLSALGMSMSEAINLFLHQVVLKRGLPFEVVLPVENRCDSVAEAVRTPCERYGVERLVLFGSQARGTATDASDYDFRLDRGALEGMDFFALKHDLEEALGSKVDVVTTESLDSDFASSIRKDEVVVYEAH